MRAVQPDPIRCDECGQPSDVLVEFDQPKQFDKGHSSVCRACLQKALALLNPSHGEQSSLYTAQPLYPYPGTSL